MAWTRTLLDIYLQLRNKRIHDAAHGGGEQPITVRASVSGTLGRITGAIAGTA